MDKAMGITEKDRNNLTQCLCDLFGEIVEHAVLEDAVGLHYNVLRTRIEALLARMGGDAATAFSMHYGLNGEEPQTIIAISDRCGRSREQVRQDIETVKEYLLQLPVAVALFAYTTIAYESNISKLSDCHDEIEALLNHFIECEIDEAGVPFSVDNDGCLLCNVDMARYTKLYHDVVIPEGTRVIPVGAFARCGDNLTSIELPDSVEIIEAEAFAGTSIKELVCPTSLRVIGDNAFDSCNRLEIVHFNEGLEQIGAYAFYRCEKIETVDLPDSLLSIEEGAFVSTGCDVLMLPPNVKVCKCAECDIHVDSLDHWLTMKHGASTGFRLHVGESLMDDVVLDEGVIGLTQNAFSGCRLHSIQFPTTLRHIEESALDFTGIHSLLLPDGFKELHLSAFMDNLEYIRVPDSIQRFDLLVYNNPKVLATCNEDDNGILYLGNEENPYVVAINARYAKTDKVVIPEGCRIIGSMCFAGSRVKEVVLPKTIAQIGNCAFKGCKFLVSVNIPQVYILANQQGVRFLGNGMFEGCSALHAIRYDSFALHCIDFNGMCEGGKWYEGSSIDTIICMDGTVKMNEKGVLSYHRDLPKEGHLSEEDLKVDIELVDGFLAVEWSGEVGFGQWVLSARDGYVKIDSECMDTADRRFSKGILLAILDQAISDD